MTQDGTGLASEIIYQVSYSEGNLKFTKVLLLSKDESQEHFVGVDLVDELARYLELAYLPWLGFLDDCMADTRGPKL